MAVSDAIKRYLAELGGGTVTEEGCDKLGEACLANAVSTLPGTPPAGICEEEGVLTWCYTNIGWKPGEVEAGEGEAGAPEEGEAGEKNCEIWISTYPGGADYWIDKLPPAPPDGKTPDMSAGEKLKIPVTCEPHCVHYELEGYESWDNCETPTPTEPFKAYPEEGLKVADVSLAKAGTLNVNAYDKETGKVIDYAIVNLRKPTAETGGVYLGITPLTKLVKAGKYKVVVTAYGYGEVERTVTIREGGTHTINVNLETYRPEAVTVKIVKPTPGRPGKGYIEGHGLEKYNVWWVGSIIKDWIKVKTPVIKYFQAALYFDPPCPDTPIFTNTKKITPYDDDAERKLYFTFLVPDAEGVYTVTAKLDQRDKPWELFGGT